MPEHIYLIFGYETSKGPLDIIFYFAVSGHADVKKESGVTCHIGMVRIAGTVTDIA